MEYELGAPGKAYTEWAAKMAVDLGTGVPWIMCKQDDAPDPIVSIDLNFYYLMIGIIEILSHECWYNLTEIVTYSESCI